MLLQINLNQEGSRWNFRGTGNSTDLGLALKQQCLLPLCRSEPLACGLWCSLQVDDVRLSRILRHQQISKNFVVRENSHTSGVRSTLFCGSVKVKEKARKLSFPLFTSVKSCYPEW